MSIKRYYTKKLKNILYLCDNNLKVGDLILTDNGFQYKISGFYFGINPVRLMNNPYSVTSGFYNFHDTTYSNIHKPIGVLLSNTKEDVSFDDIPEDVEKFTLIDKGVLGSDNCSYSGEGFEG